MLDLELICIRKLPKAKGDSVNFHSHNYHELVYYAFGDGKTTIDGQTYHFNNNCFFVISPGEVHNEIHDADGEVICLEEVERAFHARTDVHETYDLRCYGRTDVGAEHYAYGLVECKEAGAYKADCNDYRGGGALYDARYQHAEYETHCRFIGHSRQRGLHGSARRTFETVSHDPHSVKEHG